MILRLLLCLWALSAVAGCGPVKPINTKQVRVDDLLTPADIKQFLEIAKELPEGTLRDVPPPILPTPKWDSERTLPVRELVSLEFRALEQLWKPSGFLAALPKGKEFTRFMKRKQVSPERFASLAYAISLALWKSSIPTEINVDAHMKKSAVVVNELRQDNRPYHTLSPDVAHELHRRTAWIGEFDRGEQLAVVPQLNVKAIQKSRQKLAELLPAVYLTSPFDTRLDRNLDIAMPFDDLPGNESFELLEWDPKNAVIGTDELAP